MFEQTGFLALLGFIFIVLYSFTIVGLVLLVLLENRNPLKTIPWVIVLIFVPGIGLIFYYFFGRDDRRLRIITRRMYNRFKKQIRIEYQTQDASIVPKEYLPLAKILNNSNYSAIFYGSQITHFTSGQAKFDSLFDDIDGAQHHIHVLYYIFGDDKIGNRVKDALIKKAREGVKVRVLYDGVGSWSVKSHFFDDMKKEGIEVFPILKVVFPMLTGKVNYRNHRKIVVIDGTVGYLGGMNIADRYIAGNRLGTWRDTHFRITGPGVYGLQASFLLDWYAVNSQLIKGYAYYPQLPRLSDMKMQVVMSGPTSQWQTLTQAYIFCISNAKKYIYIQTPYFLPTEALNLALQMAALGGIDVRLMIPKASDTKSTQMATFSYVDTMLKAGVKVYLYDKGFLHSKLLLIDDAICCFGSSNFDFRSFEHNFEINAFVYQKEFAAKMKRMFMQDIDDSMPVTYAVWRKRPIFRRISESFMRLFAPLL
jgi:cardiolipin synthase